ncbi:MAG TPA: glycosyltransferase family 4 protein [Geobacteraceae bacterium]
MATGEATRRGLNTAVTPRGEGEREKVAVIAPCPFFIDRGTPLRIRRLATTMAEDFSVHVIAYHQGRDGAFPFRVHRTLPLPLTIKRTGANLAKLLYDLLLVVKTLAVVRRERIRVIDGHLHEGAFIGLLVRPFTGARVIYNAHGTFVRELIATGALRERSPLVAPLSWFENWVERRVDRIVAQSLLRRDEFVAKGIPPEKVAVVEDVPELDAFHLEEAETDRALERRLRPAGERLLIYSGGMETYQGVDFLLAAFREVCARRTDVRLVLFGRPLEAYRRMGAELGVAERLVFVDDEPFERLPYYLQLCDAGFALRLYGENVPGKLPIYLASGIPVIGTDIKGVNSVVTDGATGLLVPPGDVPALVEKILWLLDHGEEAKRLGAAGRAEALRRYSPEDVRRELGRVYRELLGT